MAFPPLRHFQRMIAVLVGFSAAWMLVARVFPISSSILAQIPAAEVSTLSSLLVLALGLWFEGKNSRLLCYIAVGLAGVTVLQYGLAWYPLDRAWHMPLITAFLLMLLAVSMVLKDRVATRGAVIALHGLLGLIVVGCFVVLYGYSLQYAKTPLAGSALVDISAPATLGLLLSCGAWIAFARTSGFKRFYARREDRQIYAMAMLVVILMTLVTGLDEIWAAVKILSDGSVTEVGAGKMRLGGTEVNTALLVLFGLGMVGALALIRAVRRVAICLRSQEQLWERVLEILSVGVWVMGPDGQVLRGNRIGREIRGVSDATENEQGFYACRGWWHESGLPVGFEDWPSFQASLKGTQRLRAQIDIETPAGVHKTILSSSPGE
jgi:PAS domain-containing protein